LNLLSGILVPDSGTITVDGEALEKMNSRQRDRFRAKKIGYVTQSFNLVPYLSAIDNIELASYFASNSNQEDNDTTMETLLFELNITEDQWHRPVRQLSIGQQQRVAIARAIANKPKLLIADEPTSSLDQTNRDNFMSILMTTAKTHEMTLMFVSHDLSLSRYFDRTDSMSDINKLGA
jgi:putative ABC transport system ATP-binding protein